MKKGDHLHISCSNCNAILLDIWSVNPDADFQWKVRATCPFCGDKSYIEEIKGTFGVGGYGTPKPDDPTDDIPSTVHDGSDVIDGVYVFKVKKANENAKPVYSHYSA